MYIFENVITGEVIQGNKHYTCNDIQGFVDDIIQNVFNDESFINEPVVAIAMPRTIHLISAMLASLQTGITFLPIDLQQPTSRVEKMLNNAGIKHVLTLTQVKYDFGNRDVYYIDELKKKNNNGAISVINNELAYILYTSGTTGDPKAVEVTRVGFHNFLEAIPQIIKFERGMKIACFTNYTFDIFFLEAILPLYQGMTVILADEVEKDNPKKMMEILKRDGVQMIQMTPSRIKMLHMMDKAFTSLKGVEVIMIGGEKFPQQLLYELQQKTSAQIYNMYGPTETTIWSTVSDLTDKSKVDIGKPIQDTRVYLLSEELRKVSKGCIGEICIAGSGLAKGYLNNQELTDQYFVTLPFYPYERIYHTGDLGEYDDQGNIICYGRKDSQVKVHGHRIELEDIDSNLMKIKEIKSAVTCFNEATEELVSFYMSEERIDTSFFNKHMNLLVPQYMLPNKYFHVKEFVYTMSGKVDRKKMLMLRDNNYEESSISKVETSVCTLKDEVKTIVKNVLEKENTLIDENIDFHELGFNSISYIGLLVEIEDKYGVEFNDDKLMVTSFENINDIVEYLKVVINC